MEQPITIILEETLAFGMNSAEVALAVGFVQCCIIWYGIRKMSQSSDARQESTNGFLRALERQGAALEVLLQRTEPK